jgi:hypothetical protein
VAWIPNVNSNELILSAWGNTIRDHVVNTFATAADRTAAIPAPTTGMLTWRSDALVFEYWNGATWVLLSPGNGQLAWKITVADQTGIASTATDITGLSATVNVPAGRRLELTASIAFHKAAPDTTGWAIGYLTDASNAAMVVRNADIAAPGLTTCVIVWRVNPPAGANTYKVRAAAAQGFVNVQGNSTFSIDDIGPASMPS